MNPTNAPAQGSPLPLVVERHSFTVDGKEFPDRGSAEFYSTLILAKAKMPSNVRVAKLLDSAIAATLRASHATGNSVKSAKNQGFTDVIRRTFPEGTEFTADEARAVAGGAPSQVAFRLSKMKDVKPGKKQGTFARTSLVVQG